MVGVSFILSHGVDTARSRPQKVSIYNPVKRRTPRKCEPRVGLSPISFFYTSSAFGKKTSERNNSKGEAVLRICGRTDTGRSLNDSAGARREMICSRVEHIKSRTYDCICKKRYFQFILPLRSRGTLFINVIKNAWFLQNTLKLKDTFVKWPLRLWMSTFVKYCKNFPFIPTINQWY